jgi:hypothetical protein
MPTQDAAELMRTFKRSFAAPIYDVDRWLSDVQQEKHKQPLKFHNMGYGTSIGEHYPKIQLLSKSSQNPTYEWNFSLNLEWYSGDYPKGWSEEKAAVHNPKPPAGYEVVSLNPPSGRFYSGKEGIEIAYNVDLDKFSAADSKLTPELEEMEKSISKPVEVATPEPSVVVTEQTSQWWLWLIGGVVVVGGIVMVARRKN